MGRIVEIRDDGGPKNKSERINTEYVGFWFYKLWKRLLQITTANLYQNGNLYYRKG